MILDIRLGLMVEDVLEIDLKCSLGGKRDQVLCIFDLQLIFLEL